MTHFSRARLLLNVLSVPEFVAGGFVEKQEHIYLASVIHLFGIRVMGVQEPGPAVTGRSGHPARLFRVSI